MPLSEREQRILEDIERRLYADDPKFARHVRSRWLPRMSGLTQMKLGLASLFVGFGFLIAFFLSSSLLVGAIAFTAMVSGIVLVANSARAYADARKDSHAGGKLSGRIAGFADRLRRRRE